MKLVLNRKEMLALKNVANNAGSIVGSSPIPELISDKIFNRKAFIISLIKGSLTIDINEDMIIEYCSLLEEFLDSNSCVLSALINLARSLKPSALDYIARFEQIFDKYHEDITVEEVRHAHIPTPVVTNMPNTIPNNPINESII